MAAGVWECEHGDMSDDSWDDWADGWDDDPAARNYSRAAFASLLADLDRRGHTLEGARVLDFGCGTGLLTEQLVDAVASVHAVDLAPRMLAVLNEKVETNGWTTVHTSLTVPRGDEAWDLIVCSSVCSFLDDYPAVAGELAGRLAPDGLFVQWDWEAVAGDEDAHGLTRDEVRSALTAAGLSDVEVRTAFSVVEGEQRMEPLMGSGVRS